MTLEEIKNTYINEIKEEPYKAIKRLSTIFSENSIYKWYNSSEPVLMEDLELLLTYVNAKGKCKPELITMIPQGIFTINGGGFTLILKCNAVNKEFKTYYRYGEPLSLEKLTPEERDKKVFDYKYCPYCGREIDWNIL